MESTLSIPKNLAPSPQSSPSRGEEIGGGNFEIPYNKLTYLRCEPVAVAFMPRSYWCDESHRYNFEIPYNKKA